MAAEYGALLKWPKELERDLGDLLLKPAKLVLELQLSGKEVQEHGIIIDAKPTKAEYYEEIYAKCFVAINPVKIRLLKGTIKSFTERNV